MYRLGLFKLLRVITLQIALQLKAKNINVVPGQLFCRQCKAKCSLDRLTVLMIKIKFSLLQILTINLLNVKHQGKLYENFKEQFSEAYKVQV